MKSLTIAYAGFHLQCGELFAFQACTHLRWTFSSMCSCLLSPSAVFSGDSFTQAAFVVDLVDQVRNFSIESQIEDLQSINQIQIHPDRNSYVTDHMDQETLNNIYRVFHIKYNKNGEPSSPDVIVLSGSESSDDEFSSDGDENDDEDDTLEGDDPHNPIYLSRATNSSTEVIEESNETTESSDNGYTPDAYY
ncbi:uncharacterized protein LOC107618406 isoform X2 [Arachis ipaensis]|uniref:uncharacterized protein LOC107618406 isoform X2 n=1 Tax=Arachis ipaensis TaxID=130454 RepID=UPI0007AF07F9|nr:uncharacterized protein LOC107618406 isoform X2 [Arachis ipaensis]XP_025675492.1 uncharacterized protein LOC112775823 isoform X2 [Arachis hypogaea]